MNFFCDSKGAVFHVDPEPIYQNSAGANELYFIGAFPSSAQVTVAYKLPNGLYTKPKLMTNVTDSTLEITDQYGKGFSVWKEVIGQSVTTDDAGNIVYGQDYTVTENYGKVEVQFVIYANGQGASRLGTASSSFEIGKGVPIILPDSVENDILSQIVASLQTILQGVTQNTDDIDILQEKTETNGNDIEELKGVVKSNREDININRERIATNEIDISKNTDDILKNTTHIALLTDVQLQSGLQYIQPIAEAYNERTTANGEIILDWQRNGSTAKLLKVEGNTKGTTNLFDVSKASFRTDNDGIIEYNDTGFTFKSPNLHQQYFNGTSSPLHLKPNTTYTSKCIMTLTLIDDTDFSYDAGSLVCSLSLQNGSGFVTGDENKVKIVNGYIIGIWNNAGTYTLLTKFTTPSDLSGFNYLVTRLGKNTQVEYKEIIIVEGEYTENAMPTYTPYFDGLKSSTFQGIISRSIDGQKESALFMNAPIDCGLGVTIDFENKKIVKKYQEITLNGSEDWEMSMAINGNKYFSLISQSYPENTQKVGDAVMINFKQVAIQYLGYGNCTFALYNLTDYPFILEIGYSLATTVEEWKKYLANNPLTLRYITEETVDETIFTDEQKAVGNEYTAWTDGTEQVTGNESALYEIYPTLTQEYVLVMDIKETTQETVDETITQALLEAY